MWFEQFQLLCSKIGTSPTPFVKNVLGLSSSKVTAWSNGSIPKYEILKSIADYFEVTVGFLFDGEENSTSNISDQEKRCLKAFRRLKNDDKIDFLARMEQRYDDYDVKPQREEKGA